MESEDNQKRPLARSLLHECVCSLASLMEGRSRRDAESERWDFELAPQRPSRKFFKTCASILKLDKHHTWSMRREGSGGDTNPVWIQQPQCRVESPRPLEQRTRYRDPL
jgi:hypothetical protein